MDTAKADCRISTVATGHKNPSEPRHPIDSDPGRDGAVSGDQPLTGIEPSVPQNVETDACRAVERNETVASNSTLLSSGKLLFSPELTFS